MPKSRETFVLDQQALQNVFNKVQQYSIFTKKSLTDLVNQNMRLLVKDLIGLTPPDSRKQGEDAVARDIAKTMETFDTKQGKLGKKFAQLAAERKYGEINKIMDGIPAFKGREAVEFDPMIHEKRRQMHTSIEIAKGPSKMILDDKKYKRYVKEVQSRVGKLKASWMAAANHFGVNMTSWINRHYYYAGRVGTCDVKNTDTSMSIVIRNSAKGTNGIKRGVNWAVKNRVREIQERIQWSLDYLAGKVGKKQLK